MIRNKWIEISLWAVTLFLAMLLIGCNDNPIGCNPSQPNAPPPNYWFNFGKCGANYIVGPQFIIPAQSSGQVAGYVYEAPPALAIGQTITLNYSVNGYGALGINDPKDIQPASITLFIWEKGDDLQDPQHRWWCPTRGSLVMGMNQVLSCTIGEQWTNVNGGAAFADGQWNPGFIQALGNAFGVGFTFGGAYFYGHGVYTTTGQITFTINSYTVE